MDDQHKSCQCDLERRHFLTRTSLGLGSVALASLLKPFSLFGNADSGGEDWGGILGSPHHTPKIKRVIYLFQSGGPSQLELFDYKPLLRELNGAELPDSVRGNQRLTGMTAHQKSFPMAGSIYDFAQHGESRAWVSELMPYTAQIVDELCFVKSMHTEAINH
ncbi:MAG: DUF1501 domain-containing protein, partial [Candidatus Marinimicrobia bacterium]|nr:DUF1501 domain-containing protein [Candidatus Neomarinimicrobiota bacterium]